MYSSNKHKIECKLNLYSNAIVTLAINTMKLRNISTYYIINKFINITIIAK